MVVELIIIIILCKLHTLPTNTCMLGACTWSQQCISMSYYYPACACAARGKAIAVCLSAQKSPDLEI